MGCIPTLMFHIGSLGQPSRPIQVTGFLGLLKTSIVRLGMQMSKAASSINNRHEVSRQSSTALVTIGSFQDPKFCAFVNVKCVWKLLQCFTELLWVHYRQAKRRIICFNLIFRGMCWCPSFLIKRGPGWVWRSRVTGQIVTKLLIR